MRRARAAFTLFELVVVLSIVAFLGATMANRVEILQARAERATVEHVIGALRSALALEMAARVVRGGEEEHLRTFDTNPMDRLSVPPAAYMGALDDPRETDLEPATWYFNRTQGTLEYLVRHTAFFESPVRGTPRIRLKVHAEFDDFNRNGKFDAASEPIHALVLRFLEPYRWIDE